jgi:hypothetical protein
LKFYVKWMLYNLHIEQRDLSTIVKLDSVCIIVYVYEFLTQAAIATNEILIL